VYISIAEILAHVIWGFAKYEKWKRKKKIFEKEKG
jgi:hypothetical protein